VRDSGAVDGRWWVSRRDSRWLGPVSWGCSAGGLGVPLTDALIPFSAALSVTMFKAAAKVHNMDDEVMARVKAKPG